MNRLGKAWAWAGRVTVAVAVTVGPPSRVVGQEPGGDGGPALAAASGVPAPRSFTVVPASVEVRVDGVLDESVWAEAESIALPFEITPGDNTPSRFATDCRVTFDEGRLYLGCRAHDPDPSTIRAYVTDRDRILGNHDRISFLVDPFDDARRGWVFEISALGVQADLVYDERTSSFDASWDAIWSSAGLITGDGYTIEAALPFRSLRFPGTSDPQSWRFWISRMRPRDQNMVMRSNTRLRNESCQLCQANLLEGLRGMDPGRNVELVPTLTASRADEAGGPQRPSPLIAGEVGWEPGFDARWSVTTDLTLNATVNPDFSQVEADAPQLSANNRFALFFPEKRPFFLEGAELFSTPLRAVFTRSVADPVAGAKFSGKAGSNVVGALVARDRVNHLLIPGDQGSRRVSNDDEVTSTVLRYRRDVGESATLGAVATAREGASGYTNRLGGVDAFFRPISELTLNFQLLASRTGYGAGLADAHDLPEDPFGGMAYMADATFDTGTWGLFAGMNVRERGFRADAGFVPQVDTRSLWANVSRTFWGDDDSFLSRMTVRTGAWRDRTLVDRLIAEGLWAQVDFEGPLQSSGWLNPYVTREHVDGTIHEIRAVNAGINLRPWRDLSVGVNGNVGDAIDYRNNRPGSGIRVSPNVELRLGRNVEIQARHNIQRLEVAGEEVFTENAGQLQGVYNFGPRAFVRATLQYRRTERNPETNPDLERTLDEGLSTQVLFSYKVNPLTVLFLGFSDERVGFENTLGDGSGLTPRGRSFFLKLGYAWRP